MNLIPPSYESATDRDAWVIIAHYIPSSDLCAASLVSHRWHNLFVPFLWGDPASHFGTDNDAVYGRFLRPSTCNGIAQRLTHANSGSYAVPKNSQICQTRSASFDTYTSPSACFVRDLWWPTTRMAARYSGVLALLTVLDGIEITFLRPQCHGCTQEPPTCPI